MIEGIQQFLITHPLAELSGVLLILVTTGYLARVLKQPVLVGYIFGGLLLSPQLFDFIQHQEHLETYAHLGVSLLLFMVGLGLNPRIIREVGKVSLLAGIGQIVFTSILGFGLALALGYSTVTALYMSIALTFSSTIVIVKLISDRGDNASVYGKISLGILIVQDIIAMLILLIISASMMQIGEYSVPSFVGMVTGKVIILIALSRICMRYLIPSILQRITHTKELVLLFVIARALSLGSIWYFAGFSMEIGALLAGLGLASSRYRFHIFSELRPLRDFFIALFFVYLGSQIYFANLGVHLVTIILLSLFVLIGNPLIVMVIMHKLHYTTKTSFMTGLTVAQISEFSFIVIGLAITAGHITDPVVLSIITMVGLITMTGSSYLFKYADTLYAWIHPYLARMDISGIQETEHTARKYDVILIGYNRIGRYFAKQFTDNNKRVLIIDLNPEKIKQAEALGYSAVYGDINDKDLLEEYFHPDIERICSSLDDYDTNRNILRIVKEYKDTIKVICLAMYVEEAEDYYQHHADYVIIPHLAGAQQTRGILEQHLWDPANFVQQKVHAIEHINTYKEQLSASKSAQSS